MNTFEEWNRVISNAITLTEVLEKAFDLTTPDDVTWVYINENKELVTKTFPNLRKVIDELTQDLYTNAPLYSVDTIADLRKLDKPYDKVYVKGYYDPTDNIFGSNFYVWYPDNTDPDDKGLTIKLDNFETGRYKLVHSYPIVVGWFGVTKDNYDENFVKLLVDKYRKVYDNITNTLYDDTIRKTDSLSMTKLELTNNNSKFELINDVIVDKYYKTSDMSYIRNTIFGLTDITNPKEGDVCHVTSYYGNDDVSGTYVYKENIVRTMHDGGRYISPTRSPNNWWGYVVDEDIGCWVKVTTDSYASLKEYGGVDDGVTDNRQIITAILRNNNHIYIPKGVWKTSRGIDMNINNKINTNFYIKGEGEDSILETLDSNAIYATEGVNLTCVVDNVKLKVNNGYKGIYIKPNLINSKLSNITIESDASSIYLFNAINTEMNNIKASSNINDTYVVLNSSNMTMINCIGKTTETHAIFNIREEVTMINCGTWLNTNESTELTDNDVKCSVWGYFGYLNTDNNPPIDSRYNVVLINCNIFNFKNYGIRFRNDGNGVMINNVFRSLPNESYYASIGIDKCSGLIKMVNNKFNTDLSTRAKKSEVFALSTSVNIIGIDVIDINNVLYRATNTSNYLDENKHLNLSGYNNLYVDELVINKIDYKEPNVVVDMLWSDSSKGPVLIDRNDGTKYRLFINNGNLGIEEV